MKIDVRGVLFSLALFALPIGLSADWCPEDVMELDASELEVLKEVKFVGLKKQVKNALQGSWCSADKVELLMDVVCLTKPKTCVEIGAFSGSSILPIAAALKKLKCGQVIAIDPWSNKEAIKNLDINDPNYPWWSKVDMRSVRANYDKLIKQWGLSSVVRTIAKTSEKAVGEIPAIDFLHLDGNYSEKSALQDVELYVPKVKEGGYILLSNLFVMVNEKQPKLKSFCHLFDNCEMICEIDRDNAVLFQKN